ncbi:MAG: RNA 2',3'-cyclic phosphodiesterase [Anaerolineae bacterium]|nr:RNA 2',3'-cyclic phosphodiesterase [Anaerolineae bacterium]
MRSSDILRTFVALPLSSALHGGLGAVQRDLQRACPAGVVRWVKAEGIHLTLFFLGDVLASRLPDIQQVLASVAELSPRIEFAVEGVGTFPNPHRPNVIWVGVCDVTGHLAALHRDVNSALASLGFQPEERAFKPHLTLGRVNRNAGSDAASRVGEAVGRLKLGRLSEECPRELILFRSELKSTGAEYTPLQIFPLGVPNAESR